LVGQFGSVTNDGYALHAAQFYGAMYAAAAFESNVENVVAAGIEVVPASSRTHEIIQDVQNWYAADRDDDGILDWRSTQEKIYDKYVGVDSKGRFRDWIESSMNLGLTTMAVLYGEGDFKETVKIGVLGGFDSDCNPATAGGLVGLIQGFSGLPSDLTSTASDDYDIQILLNTSPTDTTISAVALGWQAVAESMILAAGGTIDGEGAARTYHIPDDDTVLPPPERPDPAGPGGLVGQVLAAGGSVTPSASIALHNPDNDRENLDAIIDGIRDVSYNGHLPYMTDDGDNAQPAGGDFYQLDFDRDVTFTSVIFSEGDIKWATINSNPKWSEPRGGYFLNLTVEVEIDGEFVEVEFLESSEALDPFAYFQEIELAFEPVVSRKIRIRGDAGGTAEFTSIVELAAFGLSFEVAPGDVDVNGAVDGRTLPPLALTGRRGAAAAAGGTATSTATATSMAWTWQRWA
ncbi:MAG: ADP-ribosylglycohydrolase family protein, partial [Phycisphaerae bacterium]|nr:ADP-ribosylglycohydrolase family protein [Phycisphaerae bacterium]